MRIGVLLERLVVCSSLLQLNYHLVLGLHLDHLLLDLFLHLLHDCRHFYEFGLEHPYNLLLLLEHVHRPGRCSNLVVSKDLNDHVIGAQRVSSNMLAVCGRRFIGHFHIVFNKLGLVECLGLQIRLKMKARWIQGLGDSCWRYLVLRLSLLRRSSHCVAWTFAFLLVIICLIQTVSGPVVDVPKYVLWR